MEPVKVIPCLDMKDGRVVKGVHFVGLRDAGDPVENARFYREAGADEVSFSVWRHSMSEPCANSAEETLETHCFSAGVSSDRRPSSTRRVRPPARRRG